MGKGDIRTRRGKLFAGSHGKTRSRTTNKAAATAKRNKKTRSSDRVTGGPTGAGALARR